MTDRERLDELFRASDSLCDALLICGYIHPQVKLSFDNVKALVDQERLLREEGV